MYPGLIFWWKNAQHRRQAAGQCHEGAWAGCGSVATTGGGGSAFEPRVGSGWRSVRDHRAAAGDGCGDSIGGGLGVKRPLRFLAYKLQLSDGQVAELARILNELKTERAQADVDDRRAMASLADAVAGAAFDEATAAQAAERRVQGTRHLQDSVIKALGRIHALLNSEQRADLAYLIRTGTLSL